MHDVEAFVIDQPLPDICQNRKTVAAPAAVTPRSLTSPQDFDLPHRWPERVFGKLPADDGAGDDDGCAGRGMVFALIAVMPFWIVAALLA